MRRGFSLLGNFLPGLARLLSENGQRRSSEIAFGIGVGVTDTVASLGRGEGETVPKAIKATIPPRPSTVTKAGTNRLCFDRRCLPIRTDPLPDNGESLAAVQP